MMAISTALGGTPPNDWFDSLTESQFQADVARSHYAEEKIKSEQRKKLKAEILPTRG